MGHGPCNLGQHTSQQMLANQLYQVCIRREAGKFSDVLFTDKILHKRFLFLGMCKNSIREAVDTKGFVVGSSLTIGTEATVTTNTKTSKGGANCANAWIQFVNVYCGKSFYSTGLSTLRLYVHRCVHLGKHMSQYF